VTATSTVTATTTPTTTETVTETTTTLTTATRTITPANTTTTVTVADEEPDKTVTVTDYQPAPVTATTTATTTAATGQTGMVVVGHAAPVAGNATEVTLKCTGGPCRGSVRLVAAAARNGGAKRAHPVVIGTANFAMAANGRETVTIDLTKRGRRMLSRRQIRHLNARVSGAGVEARTLVLKVAGHHGRHKHRHNHG
jgi:hypothetical protein